MLRTLQHRHHLVSADLYDSQGQLTVDLQERVIRPAEDKVLEFRRIQSGSAGPSRRAPPLPGVKSCRAQGDRQHAPRRIAVLRE